MLAALPLSAVTASAPPDGLFPDCPDANVCVSSQDDRPQCWDNPWIAEEELSTAMLRLRSVVEKRLKGTVTDEDERYLRAEFRSAGPFGGSGALDVAEFYFTPNDVLVQFRAARQGASGLEQDFGANRNRLEQARVALGWEKVPVLRNRRRALVVVESPLDSFGPAMCARAWSWSPPRAPRARASDAPRSGVPTRPAQEWPRRAWLHCARDGPCRNQAERYLPRPRPEEPVLAGADEGDAREARGGPGAGGGAVVGARGRRPRPK